MVSQHQMIIFRMNSLNDIFDITKKMLVDLSFCIMQNKQMRVTMANIFLLSCLMNKN